MIVAKTIGKLKAIEWQDSPRNLSVCFCLDKCGQAMVDRMDLPSKDALTNFVNTLDCQNILSVESMAIQRTLTPQQGSLTTSMREMWKTLYSTSLLTQE